MMKFEVGKIYKDQYEMEFKVIMIVVGDKYPIICRNDFSEEISTYTSEGQYDIDQSSMFDLIKPAPTFTGQLVSSNEALYIIQEECGEVIQAISKILRFGWEAVNPVIESDQTNKEHLEEELGDLLAMVDIVISRYNLSDESIDSARLNKTEKLKIWSNIFK